MRRWGRWGTAAAVAIVAAVTLGTTVIDAPPAQADQIRDMQYWLADYGFDEAWLSTKGAGVTVAVIDTGIDGSVAELKGAIVGGMDASGIGTQNGQTPVGDNSQHGTMVASLLAGRGRGPVPGSGVIGVAPEAELLAASVAFGTNTGSTVSNDDQIATAVRWAVDNGADVINMSLTRNTLDWPQSWDDAFLYAFEHDVVVVAAAGNRGAGTAAVGAPATIPGVLTVAGVDRDGDASFDASSQGITISVAAPSEDLVGVVPGGGYAKWDGTSGAAPIVSGLVALVRSAYPELGAADVINRVVSTAVPRGAVQIYGNGLIDADAAVNAEVAAASTDPETQLKEWVHLHRRAAVAPSEEEPATREPIVAKADPPAPEQGSFASIIPNSFTMTTVVVPILVLAGFAILIVLLGIGATRHFRRILRR
ncbi:type VII secretion-associated serine protease mycosin [Microterricola viridarii]|uniref:Type VII secretion-associated serine protease mycosin n=2 Tax=Microterricola viridarii TaxID=412690 RepID=A0A1H1XQJ1_9MICO|nr:type VII secretion-associated serine protease mycosin [Microterricola viridarii]